MYGAVLTLLQSLGIQDKIFSITLDNASSNDKMQDYLKKTLIDQASLLYEGSFFHVRCAAHVLNLIVNDGLTFIKHSLIKIRESVKYVKWSESRKNSFKYCISLAMISETKGLWLDMPTRWNSNYMMLDRALLYQNAFKELAVFDKAYKYLPDSTEWDMLERIRYILEPFAEITELFSGSANLYFENVWKIAMILERLMESDNKIIRTMGKDMKLNFDKYWDNSDEDDYTTLFAFSVVLDPCFKLSFLKFCYERLYGDETRARRKVNDVKFKLGMFLKEYGPNSRDNSFEISAKLSRTNTNRTPGNVKRKYDFLADFDKEESTNSSPMKTKLDVYLEDVKVDRRMKLSILDWWKENETHYGELAHLARDILSVPLTTVTSESTFSIGGRILNKWRASYLPENVKALITTRSWLYGYESLKEDDFVSSTVEWSTAKTPSGNHR